jgi:hypothetical protein
MPPMMSQVVRNRQRRLVRLIIAVTSEHRSTPPAPGQAGGALPVAGGGAFRTTPLSLHTRTNMDVISRFGGVRFDVQAEAGAFGWRVTVRHQG